MYNKADRLRKAVATKLQFWGCGDYDHIVDRLREVGCFDNWADEDFSCRPVNYDELFELFDDESIEEGEFYILAKC